MKEYFTKHVEFDSLITHDADVAQFIKEHYPTLGVNVFVNHTPLGSFITDTELVVPVSDVLDKATSEGYRGEVSLSMKVIDAVIPPHSINLQSMLHLAISQWNRRGKKRVTSKDQETYIIKDTSANLYKIGKSHDPIRRIERICANNTTIKLIMVIERNVETELHHKYAHRHSQGEWYNLTEDDLIDIYSNYKTTNKK